MNIRKGSIMSNLDNRIRAIANDVSQGDIDGSLREEVNNLKQYVDDEVTNLQNQIHDLQQKQSGNR